MKKSRKIIAVVMLVCVLFCGGAFLKSDVISDYLLSVNAAETSAPKKVSGVAATKITTESITLSWEKVSGADGYKIYMKNGAKYKALTLTKSTSYTLENLSPAQNVTVKIRAYKLDGTKKIYGKCCTPFSSSTKPAEVKSLASKSGMTSVKLSWDKTACTDYRVYQLVSNKWKRVAVTTDTSVTVKKLISGGTYKFKVRAMSKDVDGGLHYSKYTAVKTVKLPKYSVSKVDVAEISLQTFTGNAIEPDLTLSNGKTKLVKNKDYTFTLKNNVCTGKASIVIKGKGEYAGTRTVDFYIVPQRTTIKSVASPENETAEIVWNADSQCDGYQIKYAASGTFLSDSHSKIISGSKNNSLRLSSLNSITTNYIKVRAYKTIDGKKYYGSWSEIATVIPNGIILTPSVLGQTETTATDTLERLGFSVITEYASSDTIHSGNVISQSVSSGANSPYGEKITIVVSAGGEWVESEILPSFVTADDYDIAYNNTYSLEAATTDTLSDGWSDVGYSRSEYVNDGDPYESYLAYEQTPTCVVTSYYYFHYCGSETGMRVNYYPTDEMGHLDSLYTISDVDVYEILQDDDPGVLAYKLKYAGTNTWFDCKSGLTCSGYGDHDERSHYWYRMSVYQNKKEVIYHNFEKQSGWTNSTDPQAVRVTYKYRLK